MDAMTHSATAASADPTVTERQLWMAVLARADADDIARRLEACGPVPDWQVLRGPESGLVMVRGRAGGGGAAFNLGEMTVTRCTVRTTGGRIGHAYVAGRDAKARLAALVDALLQAPDLTTRIHQGVISPLLQAQQHSRAAIARKAAATKVQFFTLANMRT